MDSLLGQTERTMQNRLREFEELVLLSVLIAGDEAYGVSIQRILEEDAGRAVSLGAIYTALDRLSQKGLVRSELGEPTPVRGGRRKRYYALTQAGLAQVREARRVRETMWEKIHLEAMKGGVVR
jgi:PadR family transcriptional regulator PadR